MGASRGLLHDSGGPKSTGCPQGSFLQGSMGLPVPVLLCEHPARSHVLQSILQQLKCSFSSTTNVDAPGNLSFFHHLQNKLPFKELHPWQPIAHDHNMGLTYNENASFPEKAVMKFPKAPLQQLVCRMGKAARQLCTLPWATAGQMRFYQRMPDPGALHQASPNRSDTNGAELGRDTALGASHQLACYVLSPGLDGSTGTCVPVCQAQPCVKLPNNEIQTLH